MGRGGRVKEHERWSEEIEREREGGESGRRRWGGRRLL